MNFRNSAVSSDRFFLKALRKRYTAQREFLDALAAVHIEAPSHETLGVIFVDEPADYERAEVVDCGLFEFYVGRDMARSYAPKDTPDLRELDEYLARSFSRAVARYPAFTAQERARLADVINRWRWPPHEGECRGEK
jgi:hypothetical protein